jgi:hypothetical protein
MGEKFDQCCEKATQVFMGMPELPHVLQNENGNTITSFSNTIDAAETVVAGLGADEKLSILADLVKDKVELRVDYDVVGEAGVKSVETILDEILGYIIHTTISEDSVVRVREDSNMQTHDDDWTHRHGDIL